MIEDINLSKIKPGDRIKFRWRGMVTEDWQTVTEVDPDGDWVQCGTLVLGTVETIFTAHEPAAPAPPSWWGSRVLANGYTYLIFNVAPDGEYYVDHVGTKHRPDDPHWWHGVTVVVDRDGNQPAARVHPDAYAREKRWREKAEVERDAYRGECGQWQAIAEEWKDKCWKARADFAEVAEEGIRQKRRANEARADLEAFRAKVAEVRDFLSSRAVERLRYDLSFDRGAAYAGRDAADRLSAILDGTYQ